MKALSLTQPWATLVAIGAKKVETRSWSTSYRGLIAIHASKGFPAWAKDECGEEPFYSELVKAHPSPTLIGGRSVLRVSVEELPLGAIVAVAELKECRMTEYLRTGPKFWADFINSNEFMFGDYSPKRFAWFLENIKRLPEPIPCRGALSLWEVPPEVAAEINKQIR